MLLNLPNEVINLILELGGDTLVLNGFPITCRRLYDVCVDFYEKRAHFELKLQFKANAQVENYWIWYLQELTQKVEIENLIWKTIKRKFTNFNDLLADAMAIQRYGMSLRPVIYKMLEHPQNLRQLHWVTFLKDVMFRLEGLRQIKYLLTRYAEVDYHEIFTAIYLFLKGDDPKVIKTLFLNVPEIFKSKPDSPNKLLDMALYVDQMAIPQFTSPFLNWLLKCVLFIQFGNNNNWQCSLVYIRNRPFVFVINLQMFVDFFKMEGPKLRDLAELRSINAGLNNQTSFSSECGLREIMIACAWPTDDRQNFQLSDLMLHFGLECEYLRLMDHDIYKEILHSMLWLENKDGTAFTPPNNAEWKGQLVCINDQTNEWSLDLKNAYKLGVILYGTEGTGVVVQCGYRQVRLPYTSTMKLINFPLILVNNFLIPDINASLYELGAYFTSFSVSEGRFVDT